MAFIEFEVEGAVQLSRNLKMAAVKLKDMKSFHASAIRIVGKRSDMLFKKAGSNTEKSPKWKKLSSQTKKARKKRWGYYKKEPNNPSPLRWTGRLQDDRQIIVNNKFGSIEFKAPYAKYHQKGGKNLPKRAIIDLSNYTNTKIMKALQEKINKDLGVFGLQR